MSPGNLTEYPSKLAGPRLNLLHPLLRLPNPHLKQSKLQRRRKRKREEGYRVAGRLLTRSKR